MQGLSISFAPSSRTPSTKEMLEQAERRVAELEAALQAAPAIKSKVFVLPAVVESYLKDLRGTLARDTERSRMLPGKVSWAHYLA